MTDDHFHEIDRIYGWLGSAAYPTDAASLSLAVKRLYRLEQLGVRISLPAIHPPKKLPKRLACAVNALEHGDIASAYEFVLQWELNKRTAAKRR